MACSLLPPIAVLAAFLVSLPAQVHVREWGERYVDTFLAAQSDYVAVGTGNTHVLAIRANGRPCAWGFAEGCELHVPPWPVGVNGSQITGGHAFTLVLTDQGQIIGRGANGSSQLQIPALPPGVTYTRMSACHSHSVAVRSDGQIAVWGDNWGPGPSIPSLLVVPPLPPGVVYTDAAIGMFDAVALRSDGQIVSWGSGGSGLANIPPLLPGRAYVQVDVDTAGVGGTDHAIALVDDGTAVVWGGNPWWGDVVPPLPPGVVYVQVAAGAIHNAALRSDGVVVAWGGSVPQVVLVPQLPLGVVYTSVSCGMEFSIGLRSDGRAETWGEQGWWVVENAPAPPAGARYVDVANHANHVAAVASNGSVRAWGLNALGECDWPSLSGSFTDVAAGIHFTIALRTDGTIAGIGDNSMGQLVVPPLPAGVSYTAIAAGAHQSAALRSDGGAVAWGYSSVWYTLVVVPPPPGLQYEQVEVSDFGTSLLRSDGVVVVGGLPAPWISGVATSISGGRMLMARMRDGTIQPATILNCPLCVTPPPPWGVYYVEIDSGGTGLAIAARRSDGEIVVWGDAPASMRSVPPLAPNESYLQVDVGLTTIAARFGPTSTYVSFAAGCAGSLPASRLIPHDTPRLGAMLRVEVDNLPQNLAVLVGGYTAIGGGGTPLTPFGMPGCFAHVSVDAVAVLAGTGGWARYEQAIPRLSVLVGATFHHQAIVFDLAAGNALGVVVSDAARFVIGR